MKIYIFILFSLLGFIFCQPAIACKPSKTMADINQKAKIAENFETLVFLLTPKLKNFISFFDLNSKNCHLMVYIKETLFKSKKSDQNSIYNAIQKLWKETKHVREENFSQSVDVRFFDFKTAKEHKVVFLK